MNVVFIIHFEYFAIVLMPRTLVSRPIGLLCVRKFR